IERQVAVFAAPQILRLQFEIRVRGVAGGRVLPHEIRDPHARVAAEGVAHRSSGGAGVGERAIAWRRTEQRETRAPTVARADIPAHMPEYRCRPGPVLVAVAAGKRASAAELGAELEKQVGRREPPDLRAVIAELRAEEGLVGERRVDEVPGVRVL